MFEVEQSQFECICGQQIQMPPELAGRRGRCVSCGRLLRVAIASEWLKSAEGSLQQQHYLRYSKVRLLEPGFARMESSYSSAQLCTAVPGVVTLTVCLGLMNAIRAEWKSFLTVIGGDSAETISLPACLTLILVVASSVILTVAEIYRRQHGVSYRRDRVRFALSGGYDIARWVPICTFCGIFLVYYLLLTFLPSDPIHWLRSPWLYIAISGMASHVVAGFLSWRYFIPRKTSSV